MNKFRMIMAVVVLVSCIFIVFNDLFQPQPIQVVLENGQEVTTQNPNYYALPEVLLLVISSFLVGATATYLFYNSENLQDLTKNLVSKSQKIEQGEHKVILNLLKDDEKKIFLELSNNNGEMLQNKLVEKTGLSKVSVTRAVLKLEHKNLILKERHGLTNKIKLKI